MSATVTRRLDRTRVWEPAPDRESIPQPTLSIQEQLAGGEPWETPARPGCDEASTPTTAQKQNPPIHAPVHTRGEATRAADQRQQLRHAPELLCTFTTPALEPGGQHRMDADRNRHHREMERRELERRELERRELERRELERRIRGW